MRPASPSPVAKIAGQELQQGAERQIGNDQEGARGDHQRQVSPEGDLQHALQEERLDQHDQEEDAEQRRELADQRDDRIAAGAFEPGPRVAAAEFGADRIARGQRDHHMDDRRQQRAQQELRIVLLRIDERDGLRGQRSRSRPVRARRAWRGRRRPPRRKAHRSGPRTQCRPPSGTAGYRTRRPAGGVAAFRSRSKSGGI